MIKSYFKNVFQSTNRYPIKTVTGMEYEKQDVNIIQENIKTSLGFMIVLEGSIQSQDQNRWSAKQMWLELSKGSYNLENLQSSLFLEGLKTDEREKDVTL